MSKTKSKMTKLAVHGSVLVLLFVLGCSEQPQEPIVLGESEIATFQPAPFESNNAFDSVGYYHNGIVQAGMYDTDLSATDTANAAIFWSEIRKNIVVIPVVDPDDLDWGRDYFVQNQSRDWSDYLSNLSDSSLTEREENYIHRIGDVFGSIQDTTLILDSLAEIEDDIIAETWPSGDTTEVVARVAISIAKHSVYLWKWVFNDQNLTDFNKIHEEAPDGIYAADVAAGLKYVVTRTGEGKPITGIGMGTASAAASISKAIVTYWDAIMGFLSDVWETIKSWGRKLL